MRVFCLCVVQQYYKDYIDCVCVGGGKSFPPKFKFPPNNLASVLFS